MSFDWRLTRSPAVCTASAPTTPLMAETGIPPAWVRCPAQRWPPACYATFGCIAAQRERAPRCGRGTRCDPTEDCNRMVTRRPLRPGRGRRDRRHSGGTPKQDQPTVGAAWKYHVLPGRRTRRPQCTCTRAAVSPNLPVWVGSDI